MFNRFILVVGALFFLASCETATQDALKGSCWKSKQVLLQKQVVHQYLDQLNKHRLIN